jgi:hypothetical protein
LRRAPTNIALRSMLAVFGQVNGKAAIQRLSAGLVARSRQV